MDQDLPEDLQDFILSKETSSVLPGSTDGENSGTSGPTEPRVTTPSTSSHATKRGISHHSTDEPTSKRSRQPMAAIPNPTPSSNGSRNARPTGTKSAPNQPSSSSRGKVTIDQSQADILAELLILSNQEDTSDDVTRGEPSRVQTPKLTPDASSPTESINDESPAQLTAALSLISNFNSEVKRRRPKNELWWWKSVVMQYFDEYTIFSLVLRQGNERKLYHLKPELIPDFFKSIFDSGPVVELAFNPEQCEVDPTLDGKFELNSERCEMKAVYGKPLYTKSVTEGFLNLGLLEGQSLRITSWLYEVRKHREYVSQGRTLVYLSQESSRYITQQGFPQKTLDLMDLSKEKPDQSPKELNTDQT